MNTFGQHIQLTTFGESHGKAMGGVLDGLPAGFAINFDLIDKFIQRRQPAEIYGGTPRKEADKVQFIAGLLNGKTTGAPLAFIVENKHQQSKDYDALKNINRPSHADYVYRQKYGIYDHRGGGRASARETVVRVVAGSIATQFLNEKNIAFHTFVRQIGNIRTQTDANRETANTGELFPDKEAMQQMTEYIQQLKNDGNSTGGIVECNIKGAPAGLGSPLYNKLNAALASAMFSINAVKGFEIGAGFKAATLNGNDYNDQMTAKNGNIAFNSNNDGGIQGGLSNGNIINFRVAFKPASSISREQNTVDNQLNNKKIQIKGRHDSCIVPRAAVVVESMAALVLLDFYLEMQTDRWS